MAATHLTARSCAAARPKVGSNGKPLQTAFADDDPRGLELRVSAEGRKVWCYRYRTLAGEQRRITLGTFVDDDQARAPNDEPPLEGTELLTLRTARIKARAARAVVESGGDPASAKRRARAAAKAQVLRTFGDLADAYLLACERGEWRPKGKAKRERTTKDERNILRRHVRATLGSVALEDIDRAMIKKLLRVMVGRGIGAQTNRTHAVIRQCFAWAISEERVAMNPATGFAPLAEEKARARVVTDEELKVIWTALDSPEDYAVIDSDEGTLRALYVSRPMAILLKLTSLLLQRRSEIAGMRREELNLGERTWIIPAERTKNGKSHLVPLLPKSVTLIEEALRLGAFDRERPPAAVFPSRRDPDQPIRGDSVTHTLADVTAACGIEGITVHDLRRTGASAMASERLGVQPFIVSKVLGHSGDTGGAAAVTLTHYAVYDYAPEKRRALEAWENLLLEVVGERLRPGNVTPIKGAAA